MGVFFLHYLSKSLERECHVICILIYVPSDSILGNLTDHLGVCEGIVWAVASPLTQVNLRITFGRRISFVCGWCIKSVIISL